MKLLKNSLVLAFTLSSALVTHTALAEIAIIVNVNNANTISDDDIDRIFLGKNKSFANGDSIKAMNLQSGNATRAEFEEKALGKSSKQVKAYWAKLIFSGKAKPLAEAGSDAEALAFVAANPEAIAYVDAASVNDSVKVVKVIK